jgi:hypothetical protein
MSLQYHISGKVVVMPQNLRETKGSAIAALGNQVKRIDARTYRVKSQNGNGRYLVRRDGQEWKCNCPDFTCRNVKCNSARPILV